MLRIDLTVLSRTELKRLLAAADGRGQDALVEQLRAELATRGSDSGPAAPSRPRPPPEVFDDDEPDPMVLPDDDLPGLWLDPEARRAPPPRRRWAGLAAAAVLVVGGAAAWGLNGAPGLPLERTAPAAPAPVPPPAPRAMVARAEPIPSPAPPETPPPTEIEPKPQPTPAPIAPLAKAEPSTPRRLDPCATPPTPADRVLCNDLALNLLNHEMREAYGRAMDAGADPVAIRESQAAWRRARDPVSDPGGLARLYDRRIRELKALAGEAPRPDAAATTSERQ